MAEMTSRERVWTTLNHQEPDRVPLDIGGGASTTIVVEGYEKFKQKLGVSSEIRIMNKAFRLARLDEEVMKRLGSDCRPVGIKGPAHWTPPPSEPGTFIDVWGITWRQAFYGDNCYYWEVARNPLAEASIEDLDRYPWPDPLDPGYTAGLADEVKTLYEDTDYALMADGGFKSFWELGYMLRGYQQMLMDLVGNPNFVSALMAKLLVINIAGTGRFLDIAGPYIHVFRAADDLATQKGLLMSPKTYRTLLKPFYKKYFDFVKSKTEAKIFYHSCGNVAGLIDDLAEIGVEILNPVQVSALGDTAALKARYGDKVTFWGGIDTQHVLPNGTVAEVEAEVRTRIRDLGPRGGFVVGSVHNIQPDVPPQNILAMAEATRKFGTYPLAI
ncbi:MAG TPA: uroporphyrinogen decarboxylase family protein [Anaerolineae bacterium]|nr:uroporphyrinogen decarboxylase family protein [Anaerolineae bacterium]